MKWEEFHLHPSIEQERKHLPSNDQLGREGELIGDMPLVDVVATPPHPHFLNDVVIDVEKPTRHHSQRQSHPTTRPRRGKSVQVQLVEHQHSKSRHQARELIVPVHVECVFGKVPVGENSNNQFNSIQFNSVSYNME